jgi:hypothetical protein
MPKTYCGDGVVQTINDDGIAEECELFSSSSQLSYGVSDVGECKKGYAVCTDKCVYSSLKLAVSPSFQETCENGIDDNCNGLIDEGCTCLAGQTQSCGNNVGECRKGIQNCIPLVPEKEIEISYRPSMRNNWSFFALHSNLSTINDHDDATGIITSTSDAELLLSFNSVVRITKITINAGQDNGDYNLPSKITLYEGNETTRALQNLDLGYNDTNTTITNAKGNTSYVLKIVRSGAYSSLQEIKVYTLEGQWGACEGEVSSSPETCDERDNNCNGLIDEGINCHLDEEYALMRAPIVFDVWRSENISQGFKKIAILFNNSISFADDSIISGKTYYYKVQKVAQEGGVRRVLEESQIREAGY